MTVFRVSGFISMSIRNCSENLPIVVMCCSVLVAVVFMVSILYSW